MNETVSPASPLTDLYSHMQCFALPYGALGFTLHILANWVIFCMIADESPWRSSGIKHAPQNFFAAWLGLLGGVAISIYNAIRCRHYWPLVVVSIWKGMFAGVINGASMVANLSVISGRETYLDLYVYTTYPFAVATGLAGLGVMIEQGWVDLRMKIGESELLLFCTAILFIQTKNSSLLHHDSCLHCGDGWYAFRYQDKPRPSGPFRNSFGLVDRFAI